MSGKSSRRLARVNAPAVGGLRVVLPRGLDELVEGGFVDEGPTGDDQRRGLGEVKNNTTSKSPGTARGE